MVSLRFLSLARLEAGNTDECAPSHSNGLAAKLAANSDCGTLPAGVVLPLVVGPCSGLLGDS